MSMTANGLAKLLEECGELSQVAAKKLAYFTADTHPDGAGDLNKRMQDEIADVRAASDFVAEQFGLDQDAIASRADIKLRTFKQWHAEPTNGSQCFHAVPTDATTLTAKVPTEEAASWIIPILRKDMADGSIAQPARVEGQPLPAEKRPPHLASTHHGMRVDYNGLLGQARRALKREPALAEMLLQLNEHLTELGQRFYAGHPEAVDEFLQLYCIDHMGREAAKSAVA